MTSGKPPADAAVRDSQQETPREGGLVARETIESFAVALILAFLFRAFVAEAFVIPTGSMAPTLMGAHKDIVGMSSGFGFQSGSSSEFDNETGAKTDWVTVGVTCPLSRREQPLDLAHRANHATFSGDRILVSKFSYLWRDPQRWEVIVFKYPKDARINYIKRCIGLPNETVRIQHGDIYTRPKEGHHFSIARKPPNIVEAVLQPLADTDHRALEAVRAGVPSSWQPSPDIGQGNLGWNEETLDQPWKNGWNVQDQEESWQATYQPEAGSQPPSIGWLRYYHRVLSPVQWSSILAQGSLPAPIPRYSSRLVSDFAAYNASINTHRSNVFTSNGQVRADYRTDWIPTDLGNHVPYQRDKRYETDGVHWTGDLAVEYDLELGSGAGAVHLDLVEAGTHYRCRIDLNDGKATLSAEKEGKKLTVFEAPNSQLVEAATAATSIRSQSHHRVKFANVDNTLTLWVDGKPATFSPSNRVVSDDSLQMKDHRPRSNANDPLDAAPVGLGIEGVTGRVQRARVWRDLYYIAASPFKKDMIDYRQAENEFSQSVSMEQVTDYRKRYYPSVGNEKLTNGMALRRDVLFSTPSAWDGTSLFDQREAVEFTLGPDSFLPMGDNSMASSDARFWLGDEFLPRRLLIGRAILVFWPHFWMEPIPFLPNFGRMGLIR